MNISKFNTLLTMEYLTNNVENLYFERKSARISNNDLANEIAAMANANGGTISNQGVQIAGYGYQSLGYFNSRVSKVYSLITTGSSYSNGRCSQNDKIAGCFGTDYNSSYMPGYNGGNDSTQPTEYYGYSYGAWTYYGSSTSNDRYTVSGNNQFFSKTINYAVRPVVVLKAGVKTENEKTGDGWQIK